MRWARPNPRLKKRISTTCSPKAAVFVSTPWLFIKSPPLGHRLPHCLTECFGGVVPENPGSAHFQMVFCLLFAALPIHWISAGHLPRQSSDLEHLDRWKHRHIVRDTWVRLKMCHDHFAPCLLNLNVGDASCFIPFVSRSSPIMLGFFYSYPTLMVFHRTILHHRPRSCPQSHWPRAFEWAKWWWPAWDGQKRMVKSKPLSLGIFMQWLQDATSKLFWGVKNMEMSLIIIYQRF